MNSPPSANGEFQISFVFKGVQYTAPVKRWDSTVAATASILSAQDQVRGTLYAGAQALLQAAAGTSPCATRARSC